MKTQQALLITCTTVLALVCQGQTFQLDTVPANFGEVITFIVPAEKVTQPTSCQPPSIKALDIIETADGILISRIEHDGSSVDLDAAMPFTLVAVPCTDSLVSQVRWYVNNEQVQTENVPPYAIAGDMGGDFNPWNIEPGSYKIDAVTNTGERFTITLNINPQ